ncbi:MAG: hypothetical protein AAF629_26740 [Chloroflexota bacterium]
MAKKAYSPMCTYEDLVAVEKQLTTATTADEIRKLVSSHGPKVGYKAFCYMLGGKMSAAAMKPNDACAAAASLEASGDVEAALTIYKEVATAHKEHALANQKVQDLSSL